CAARKMPSANAVPDGRHPDAPAGARDLLPALPLFPALALPATALHVPAVALTPPGVRHPAVARSRGFPVSGMPGVPPAFPEPGAADPDITGRGRDTDHLVPRRGRGHLGHGNIRV